MSNRKQRLEKLRSAMSGQNLDNLLVTNLSNVRWLTGFTGSAGYVLITPSDARLFTDFRYREQSVEEAGDVVEVTVTAEGAAKSTAPYLKTAKRVGFESDHLTVKAKEELSDKMEPALVGAAGLFDPLRASKSPGEVALMERAQAITDELFRETLKLVEPAKVTEAELAAEMEYRARRMGADGLSFPAIVASGPHSAKPHARARRVKLSANAALLFDFGVWCEGYASDMTRTVWVGDRPDERFKEVYDVVLRAQGAALSGMRPGMELPDADRLARRVIEKAGFGEHFGHGLGHGVGLEVHEWPGVGPKGKGQLPDGVVVTAEPGIYLEGEFGVRIEDMAHVTEEGARSLTRSPKELITL